MDTRPEEIDFILRLIRADKDRKHKVEFDDLRLDKKGKAVVTVKTRAKYSTVHGWFRKAGAKVIWGVDKPYAYRIAFKPKEVEVE